MKQAACYNIMVAVLMVTACSGSKSAWDDIDYSSVYRANRARQNDDIYSQPTVLNCVNDDLYNCNPNSN